MKVTVVGLGEIGTKVANKLTKDYGIDVLGVDLDNSRFIYNRIVYNLILADMEYKND